MTLLALRDVSKSYWRGRREVRVLDAISLEVEAGQCVAVRAGKREGKSTLLQIAAGLEAPDAGAVYFEGQDLAQSTARRWWPRRAGRPVRVEGLNPRMGWVRRAGPSNKSMSMLRYVALALRDEYHDREAMRQANAVLVELGIDDLARATWRELSDSERNLMTIAHAVARRPALLLADDATDGLGADERETVLAVLRLRVERSGMAVLMAAESVPATLRAHKIITLSDGKLVKPSSPPPAEVIPMPRRDSA